jgi:hypothetical protein
MIVSVLLMVFVRFTLVWVECRIMHCVVLVDGNEMEEGGGGEEINLGIGYLVFWFRTPSSKYPTITVVRKC